MWNFNVQALKAEIILLLILAATPAFGISAPEITGYVYEMPSYSGSSLISFPGLPEYEIPTNAANLTRLRLRPVLETGEDSRLEVHYEADIFYSEETGPLFKQYSGDKTKRQALDLNWLIYNKGNFVVNHFIDRFYYRKSFDWGDLTVGRQRIAWGTGRVWQPTDLFGPISPTNYSKFEKDGADAVSLKISLGLMSDIELVYNYTGTYAGSNYGARFRTNYSEYDISLLAGWFDRTARVGVDFAGNLFGAGLRGEMLYTAGKDGVKGSVKAIAGLDYQFTEDLYGLLEFHYNGAGTTCRYCYDWAALISGDVLNVGKYYAAAQASYMVHPLISVSLMSLVNIGDGSGMVVPAASWSVSDEFSLKLGGMAFFGDSPDEYAFYPSALYLLAEWYF